MVDIIVAPDSNASAYNGHDDWPNPVMVTDLIGYFFYMTDESPTNYRMRKTEDGGRTWSAPSAAINSQLIEPGEAHANYWANWTSGITTGIVHLIWTQNNRVVSRTFDPTTDTFTPALGLTPTIVISPGSAQATHVQIGVIESGEVWCGWNSNDGSLGNDVRRAPASGAPWTDPGGTNPIEAETGIDVFFIQPARTDDPRDMWIIYFDDSQSQITLKAWDNSITDFLAESAVIRAHNWAGTEGAVAQLHSDGHLFLVSHSLSVGAHDLTFTEIVNGTTFTNRTNILTGVTGPRRAAITIDQRTGRIYVWWATTLATGAGAIDGSFTDDRGVSWSAPVQFSFDSLNRISFVLASLSVADGAFGRAMPFWRDRTPADWETNFDSSIALGPPEAPPLPPAAITPGGGSFNRLLSGGGGGFMTYITPDGRLIPFHTPHDFGRWTLSFSGFGTPPIQYITQRGPFQHGETVRDFFLRPRVIQLLIRQGFENRTRWWAGRAALLNEIRPNRQATATAALPGQLRLVQTDGTTRDLNVFISEGPRFEPRVATQWDEFAFQEVLRFIAHDPVAFDPTQIIATVTLALASDLVFPITFPITFGSGLVDSTLNITYLGTWLELPVITIVGPLEDVRIDNTTTGEKIELSADIAPGRTLTIDLREGFKTVVDDLGNNLIGIVTSDSDLATFHLAPDPEAANGVNAIRVRGTNPTGSTSVTIAYFNRYFGF